MTTSVNGMYRDDRMGGVKRYTAYKPDDWDMRIPHNILNCVCFLGVKFVSGQDAGKFMSFGTGFFVGVTQEDWDFLYLVTARHVVEEVERSESKQLEARLNKRDGGFAYMKLPPLDQWILWGDEGVDIAILPLVVDPGIFQYEALPLEMLATDNKLSDHAIGLGDDLFTVGLFTLRSGKQRNIPIIRSGIISAMPDKDEPFTRKGKPYHAYLAELRSIGGLSGSPVFVFIDRFRSVDSNLPEGRDWTYFCLGFIRAHWKFERDLSDDVVSNDAALGFNPGETLNVGIAIVMMSQYIVAILTDGKLQELRERYIRMKEQEDEGGVVEDSALQIEPVFTKDSFKDALEKVSRKISEPESKDSQPPK